MHFQRDPIYTKAAVLLFLLLETLQTILVTCDCWDVFLRGFGDVDSINNSHFLWVTLPIIGGIGKSTFPQTVIDIDNNP